MHRDWRRSNKRTVGRAGTKKGPERSRVPWKAPHRKCSQTGHEGGFIAGDRRVRTKDRGRIERRQTKGNRREKSPNNSMAAIIGQARSEGAEKPASWDGERPASGRRAAAKSGKTARFGSQNKPRGNKTSPRKAAATANSRRLPSRDVASPNSSWSTTKGFRRGNNRPLLKTT